VRFQVDNRTVEIFALVPRTTDQADYWRNVREVTRLCDKYSYSGILVYTGNDVCIEPWLAAQAMISTSTSLMPLVAVNPVYMHPLAVARMISSLIWMYERRVFVNWVTGAALRDMQALNEVYDHDARYARLLEYVTIVDRLLAGGRVSFKGKFYAVEGLQLLTAIPAALMPGYMLAGQSAAARRVAAELGAVNLQMLSPDLSGGAGALNLGIVTRATEDQAWLAAHTRFPRSDVGRLILKESMQNTDSEWKRRLKLVAEQSGAAARGFWMSPFEHFQADQPFFVGSHSQVSNLIVALIRAGVTTFVLDVPAESVEFDNIAIALGHARDVLQGRG
jgi:alkanesulfonate monooxygenase